MNNRRMLNGMVWILRTGGPWRDLPERYGPWNTVYTRFYRWSRSGQLRNILEALSDGQWVGPYTDRTQAFNWLEGLPLPQRLIADKL